jgi:hypothetical protein
MVSGVRPSYNCYPNAQGVPLKPHTLTDFSDGKNHAFRHWEGGSWLEPCGGLQKLPEPPSRGAWARPPVLSRHTVTDQRLRAFREGGRRHKAVTCNGRGVTNECGVSVPIEGSRSFGQCPNFRELQLPDPQRWDIRKNLKVSQLRITG